MVNNAIIMLYNTVSGRLVHTINYTEDQVNSTRMRSEDMWPPPASNGETSGLIHIDHLGLHLFWTFKPFENCCGCMVAGYNPPGNKNPFDPQLTASIYTGINAAKEIEYLGIPPDMDIKKKVRPLVVITYNEDRIRRNASPRVGRDGNNRIGPIEHSDPLTLAIVEVASLSIVGAEKFLGA